jgi:hypothetical protein
MPIPAKPAPNNTMLAGSGVVTVSAARINGAPNNMAKKRLLIIFSYCGDEQNGWLTGRSELPIERCKGAFSYYLRLLRRRATSATPSKPAPTNSIVAGSGVVTLSVEAADAIVAVSSAIKNKFDFNCFPPMRPIA